jgi:hypothetical protein
MTDNMKAMTPEDRLEQVWAALTNPKRMIRSIQILAQEHGFDDLAEFNREFRKRYGVSAREIRAKKRVRIGAEKRLEMGNGTPGDRLRSARVSAGYQTAADAASAMGVAISTYVSHENGARGLGRAAERYARFYRVSLDWLVAGSGEPRSLDSRVHALPPDLQEEVEKFLQFLEHRAGQREPR